MEYLKFNIKKRTRSRAAAAAARFPRFSFSTCRTLHATGSAAFSIVETLVAIAILSLAVAAPLTLAQRGLNSSAYARDQITAFYLAQEAVEFIRNVRDNNNLSNNPWLSGLSDTACVSAVSGCGIDSNAPGNLSQQISNCDTDVRHCQLTFNSATGVYGEQRGGSGNPQNGWQDSIFTRTVKILPVNVSGRADEADITASVSWQSGSIVRSLSVNEKIFNWFPPRLTQ